MDIKYIPSEIMDILPEEIRQIILTENINSKIEEIRLRLLRNIHIICGNEEILIPYKIKTTHIDSILNKATNYSFYANEYNIAKGYITLKGGHRIGFSGTAIIKDGKIISLRNINSLNIRIARQIIGVGDIVLPFILDRQNILNTLIISPPRVGKTTLLRDIARQISTDKESYIGKKVCIVDERKEIAALNKGIIGLDVGQKSDVIEGGNKKECITMLIRSMSPQVIVTDEVGKKEDIEALEYCVLSGVNIIATANGRNVYDILNKNEYISLISKKIFDRFIVLSNERGKRKVSEIYNKELEKIK